MEKGVCYHAFKVVRDCFLRKGKGITVNSIQLGVPMCDWITATTFDGNLFRSMRFDWQRERDLYYRAMNRKRGAKGGEERFVVPVRKSRIPRYEGAVIDGVFFGAGVQKEEEHFCVRASGAVSNLVAMRDDVYGMRWTRVDIQLTEVMPAGCDMLEVRNALMGAAWKGRKPNIDMRLSSNGLDTVYVGSRTSERFLRVYVKVGEDGEKLIRYELELSGGWAESIRGMVENSRRAFGVVAAEVLADSLRRLPYEAFVSGLEAFEWLRESVDGRVDSPVVVRERGKTISWLYEGVLPAVKRLASNHEQRELLMDWVERLLEVCGDD